MDNKAPFTLGQAYYQEWAGGTEETIAGRTVSIPLSHIKGNVLFETLYFREKSVAVHMESVNDRMFAVAKFEDPKLLKPDIIMHADPKKEVGNQPPSLNLESGPEPPYELKRDEAVLSYVQSGVQKHIKISGIKERPGRIY